MTFTQQIPSSPLATATSPKRSMLQRVVSSRSLYVALALLLISPLPLHADDRAVVRKVAPVYPEMAKRMHITGSVRVLTTVDASGEVVKVEGQGSNKILSGAAEDAVKHWKFAPGDGTATVTIQIDFNI